MYVKKESDRFTQILGTGQTLFLYLSGELPTLISQP